VRQRLVWLISIPLALVGCEVAHTLTNALLGSPTGPGGELFDAGAPAATIAPLLPAAAAAALLVALGARLSGRWTSSSRSISALPFACLAPMAFVLQEHLELLLHTGAVPLGTVTEPTFLPGLALQLPFALAAYLVARGLLRLADGVRALIERARPVVRLAAAGLVRPRPQAVRRRARRAHSSHSGRAPPLAVTVPG